MSDCDSFPLISSNEEKIVKLNVGGQIFCASKTTFSQIPYLRMILNFEDKIEKKEDSEFQITKDDGGLIFVDRNPLFFPMILEFARTNCFISQEFTEIELKKIKLESDFYCLTKLSEMIQSILEEKFLAVSVQSNEFQLKLLDGYRVHFTFPQKRTWRFCPQHHDDSEFSGNTTNCHHIGLEIKSSIISFAMMKRSKPDPNNLNIVHFPDPNSPSKS